MLITTHIFPDPSPAQVLDAMRTAMEQLHVEDPMTVAHTLKGAIDALDQHGWATGQMMTNSGKVCAVGAIVVAANAVTTIQNSTSATDLMNHPVVGPAVMALAAMTGYKESEVNMKDWNLGRIPEDEARLIPALNWVTSWNDAVNPVGVAETMNVNSAAAAVPVFTHQAIHSEADVKELFAKAIAVLEVL